MTKGSITKEFNEIDKFLSEKGYQSRVNEFDGGSVIYSKTETSKKIKLRMIIKIKFGAVNSRSNKRRDVK